MAQAIVALEAWTTLSALQHVGVAGAKNVRAETGGAADVFKAAGVCRVGDRKAGYLSRQLRTCGRDRPRAS